MTVRELIDSLLPYAGQKIKYVVTESGEDICGVCAPDDSDKLVMITSEMDKCLTVDQLIGELEQADESRIVVTDRKADVCGVAYECVVNPTVYLKFYSYSPIRDKY